MTLRKEIEETHKEKCHKCINDNVPWATDNVPWVTMTDQICSIIKERLEKKKELHTHDSIPVYFDEECACMGCYSCIDCCLFSTG